MSGTSLASLQSDLESLKGGMKRIPFALESYRLPSLPLSAKRNLNFYAEQEPNDSRSVVALISTPGLSVDWTYGAGPILAMNGDLPGVIYVASGTEFYRQHSSTVDGALVVDDLGSIGAPAIGVLPAHDLMVTIAVGPTACVVCVPPNAFWCNHTGSLTQITDPDFPGAATVTYLDGYWVFKNYENSSQFFISKPLDPASYDALDFASADSIGSVTRIVTHRGELWMCGEPGIEVWFDAGTAGTGAVLDFPFLRQSGGVINHGVASPKSLARGDDSVFWVGTDSIVYRSIGYQAQRISNHALETDIRANDPTAVVNGMTHTESGHVFYCFTLGDQTFTYDCATKLWHNQSSTADGGGRWLGSASAIRGGVQLIGDFSNGNVYFTDPTSGNENGVQVLHQTIMPPIWAGTYRAFMNRLEIEMEVGGNGPGVNVLLEWSDDGGWTYTGLRHLDAGTFTERRKRVYATRLGSFRQRIFRITTAGRTTLFAVDADITAPKAG